MKQALLVVGGLVAFIFNVSSGSYLKGCDAALRHQDENTSPETRKAMCEFIQDTYK